MKTVKDYFFGLKIKQVNGNFDIADSFFESLEGCPEIIDGAFYTYANALTNLKGGPRLVKDDYDCSINDVLKSLEGCPEEVGGDFDCSDNGIESLIGGPKYVWGNFNCSGNALTSLEGCPTYVGGWFYAGENHKEFTEEEIRAVCKVQGEVIID